MKIFSEESLLDINFRKAMIAEIEGTENQARKQEYLKRYEIYKDKIVKYVLKSLAAEGLQPSTIKQMENRAANISVCKKIINKIARTYSGGVMRQIDGSEELTSKLDDLVKLLNFDEKMKKSDRFRELYKNCMLMVAPEVDAYSGMTKLKMRVKSPWQYDVIEDAKDKETPRVVILSEYSQKGDTDRDYNDQVIADNPRDNQEGKKKEYIFWSNTYHFTTNEKGEIIASKSPEDLLNPIGILTFVNNADEQDGFFWAEGGEDLISGSVLINKILTDMFFIAYLQGYGQPVLTGKNIPKNLTFGPNNAICLEYDSAADEPKPEVDFVSANPPLDAWMKSVELYVALLLTTNNLSAANVSTTLNASSFPSGIAMLIEMSEAIDDIEQKQKDYKAIERQLWEIIARWHNILVDTGDYEDDFKAIGKLPEDIELSIKFNDLKQVVSEKEKLENIKARKELGINKMAELILIDNPDLTMEQAEQKLLEIQEEKLNRMSSVLTQSIVAPITEDSEDDDIGK